MIGEEAIDTGTDRMIPNHDLFLDNRGIGNDREVKVSESNKQYLKRRPRNEEGVFDALYYLGGTSICHCPSTIHDQFQTFSRSCQSLQVG